jgi:hypothetical protein
MQIKRTAFAGPYPLSSLSTAFNLDYYGAVIRAATTPRGRAAAARATLGSVGAYYSGRWHH